MRIAQIAPLIECVPPKLYGGTERVVSWLTEELVRKGHSVTLFASGDSTTKAELAAMCPQALRHENWIWNKDVVHALMLEKLSKRSSDFDIVHFHLEYLHLPYMRTLKVPSVSTLHAPLDYEPFKRLYGEFPDVPLVSISKAQRQPSLDLKWQANIYHGLPKDLYAPMYYPENYLLFLGRITPEKGIEQAIEIAELSGLPLKIAAKVDAFDASYFQEKVQKLLAGNAIEFLGEVDDAQKNDLLGRAYALLHPVQFSEPFGLTLIEAMACGTPVVAFRRGSIPEIIQHGVTGFVCDDICSAVNAVTQIDKIDRRACRQIFEDRFTSSVMADHYVDLYNTLLLQKDSQRTYGLSMPATFPVQSI